MKKKISPKTKEVIDTIKNVGTKTDPQGCYTGRPNDKSEKPVQDQDDM